MREVIEISKERFENVMNSVNYYDACKCLASVISEDTIWPALVYGIYAPRVWNTADGRYYVSWVHKSYKKQQMPYV